MEAIENLVRQKMFSGTHPETAEIGIVTVTPEMAAHFLTYEYEGQRNTDPHRVERYATAMAAGNWRGGDGLIVIGVRPSRFCLVAGKHRMEAIVKSNMTVELRVEWRRYSDDEVMDKDYAETNSGKVLTRGQALSTMGTAALISVPPAVLAGAASGLVLIGNEFVYGSPKHNTIHLSSHVVMHELLVSWEKEIYAYSCAIKHAASGRPFEWFQRSPVIAVGLITFRYQPQRAEDFWRMTASNDGLRKGTPEHSLYTLLSTQTFSRSGDSLKGYALRVCRAWNAYYKGTGGQIIRGQIAGRENPIVIEGTPWVGKDAVKGLDILEGKV